MINRAKCKLCNKVIESHLPDEIVMCPCETIGVADGAAMRTYCKDNRYSEYFARVDDMGHEIPVEYRKEPTDVKGNESANEPIEPSDLPPYVIEYVHVVANELYEKVVNISNKSILKK